jgi:hypothetical protein
MTACGEQHRDDLEALMALLHRLDREYGRMQSGLDLKAKDELRAGKNLADVIFDMSQCAETMRAAHRPLITELNGALQRLCELYLNGPEELRACIRDAFSGQRMLLVHLINLSGTACLSIPQGNAAHWLRIGLAALSMEDNRTDYRDTIVALQYLHAAAVKAGIEPETHFREVAALSSDAMRDSLMRFSANLSQARPAGGG